MSDSTYPKQSNYEFKNENIMRFKNENIMTKE